MSRRPSIPSYRLHLQSGQAVVTLRDCVTRQRRDVLLGTYNSSESRSEYARVIAEWQASSRSLSGSNSRNSSDTDITLNEVMLAYWQRHVAGYYVKDGKPTTQQHRIKQALRPVRELYGHTLVKDFGPLALKAVRQKLVGHGYVRRYVNQLIGCIKQMFKWGVAEELVPPSCYHGLSAVVGLRQGRCEAKESRTVKPVAWSIVEQTLPYMNRFVAAMVEVQYRTGMRSGEVVLMRACDIDLSGKVWLYRPQSHKTQHHGKDRVIALGPKAQKIIRPFLTLDLTAYLFSPATAECERIAARAAQRKTPLSCGNRTGTNRKQKRQKKPGERYSTSSYLHAVVAAIEKADLAAREDATVKAVAGERELPHPEAVFVPRWHPHQLRHAHATDVRKKFGLEAAQVALGHAQANITQLYAEKDVALAAHVALEMG